MAIFRWQASWGKHMRTILSFALGYVVITMMLKSKEDREIHESYEVQDPTRQVSAKVLQSCPDRVEHIREVCARRGWDHNTTTMYNRILVDDKHKVLYCVVAKAACTTFKQILIEVNSNTTDFRRKDVHGKMLRSAGLRFLGSNSKTAIETKLRTYKKFMAVRHPFDRLLSAYNDKFLNGTFFPRKRKDVISDVFPSIRGNKHGDPQLDMHQFLEMIAREYNDKFSDFHWLSFYDTCNPCGINYDAVIKLETLSADIGSVLDWLDYDKHDVQRSNAKRDADLKEKFRQVSSLFKDVKPDLFKRILDIYGRDLELFGYSWSAEEGAGCSNVISGQEECC